MYVRTRVHDVNNNILYLSNECSLSLRVIYLCKQAGKQAGKQVIQQYYSTPSTTMYIMYVICIDYTKVSNELGCESASDNMLHIYLTLTH